MSFTTFQLIIFSVFLFLFLSHAQPSFRPDALVVPVRKDAATNQYVTRINQGTPLVQENLVVDLGGRFLWVDCDNNYVSSTYQPASGVSGMAGLGRTRIGLPTQLAAAFSFDRKFAICLSSSTTSDGVIFFGDGPYSFLPGIDISQSLTSTRLFINPVSTASSFTQGEPSAEYFIGVTSIRVNNKSIPLNTSLLSIDTQGNGGTKISTVNPYTVLETSIYNALTTAYIAEAAARNITRVASVAPFGVCFNTTNVLSTRVGPSVPSIELVLENENTVWVITGSNSMVQVNDNTLCLGIVNGGSNPRTSVVIGGYQLENNLLQFDIATSNLRFSSTLLGRQTTCANFNFTSSA
nr:basic 7S globulin-like [Tanacetum cinerariifolium]